MKIIGKIRKALGNQQIEGPCCQKKALENMLASLKGFPYISGGGLSLSSCISSYENFHCIVVTVKLEFHSSGMCLGYISLI